MRDIVVERREIDAAVEKATVCTMFQETVAAAGDVEALKWKSGGAWGALTWKEYGSAVRDLAHGFMGLGLQPGEFVAILAANRPEYYVTDLAVLHAGGVPVSLYNTLAPEQLAYIINHCAAGYIIVENPAFLERIVGLRTQIGRVRKIIMMEGAAGQDDWVTSYAAVIDAGRAAQRSTSDALERRWRAVTPDALATLIYTSGTTGPPKGVMVTHRNVAWTAESLSRIIPRSPGTRHISYLPMAHIAERMAGHYLQIKGASTCYFCPNPQEIAHYLTDVRPQFFFAVPRIWEKLHAGLTNAIANADEAQRAMAQGAIAASQEKVRLEQAHRPVPSEVEERAQNAKMVTGFIRQRCGLDAVEIAASGAAAIAAELLEWFFAIGVPIYEVYGQSEDTGPTSWNRPGMARIGTVGPTVPGVEVKLAADGELLVRGGNVTAGYYKEDQLTAETFDTDGWLHSGDVAAIEPDGCIRIVDRKKEIIITAGGKNIAPSNLENALKQKPLIGQACVIGDRRPFVPPRGLLAQDPRAAWARQRGLSEDLAVLASHPAVRDEVQRCIEDINQHLSNVERIKKFVVLPSEWTVESGELTPTLKMKRKVVNEQYRDVIERLYAGNEGSKA